MIFNDKDSTHGRFAFGGTVGFGAEHIIINIIFNNKFSNQNGLQCPQRWRISCSEQSPSVARTDCSTLEAARLLDMAVRSVQLMVDRGHLEAWKTPGGHRRIARSSVERWLTARQGVAAAAPVAGRASGCGRVLVIEDSRHHQNLVSLLLRKHFPTLVVTLADEGISGLALAGQLQPQVLIVDIVLSGIDGATLNLSLRSHPQFAASRLIVISSLDETDREAYRLALEGVAVVHKSRLVTDLPARLREALRAEPATCIRQRAERRCMPDGSIRQPRP